MLIHPINCKSHTIGDIDQDCIQPNAIDLRVKSIRRVTPGLVRLIGDTKVHQETVEVESIIDETYYVLEAGKYDVLFDIDIKVESGEAGWLIQRSTLNRNGIQVTSGLYDSGYNGPVGGMLHIPEGTILQIGKRERLAQLIMVQSESLSLYDGVYNK